MGNRVILENENDMSQGQVIESVSSEFRFKHKAYEERLAECGGVAEPYKYDWGAPKGREMF